MITDNLSKELDLIKVLKLLAYFSNFLTFFFSPKPLLPQDFQQLEVDPLHVVVCIGVQGSTVTCLSSSWKGVLETSIN